MTCLDGKETGMKLRSTLRTFAFLLLMGSLASAAALAQAVTPSVLADAAEAVATMSPAETSSGCPTADLPFLSPAPTEKGNIICGICSDTLCQGKDATDFCAYRDGQIYTCLSTGQPCRASFTTWRCFCYLNIP
jgi:hypothetical protein